MTFTARQLVAGQRDFTLGPLDLDLPTRSLTLVLGPNGSGKTTLLRTLAGLVAPLTGEFVAPRPVALLPPPGGAALPYSASYVVLLGRAGTRGLGLGFGPADHAAAHRALARLSLQHLADRPFARLSSGEQQRVLLARTLAQDARLLLLDEPTALLDPAQVAALATLLTELAAEGRTLVIATHDLRLVAHAQQLVLLGSTPQQRSAAALDSATLAALYGAPISVDS